MRLARLDGQDMPRNLAGRRAVQQATDCTQPVSGHEHPRQVDEHRAADLTLTLTLTLALTLTLTLTQVDEHRAGDEQERSLRGGLPYP